MSHLSPAYSVIRTTVATYTGRAGSALRRFNTSAHQVPVVREDGQTETHNIIYSGDIPGGTGKVTSFGHKHLISPGQSDTPGEIHTYRRNQYYKKKFKRVRQNPNLWRKLGPSGAKINTFFFIKESDKIIADQVACSLTHPGSDMVEPGNEPGEHLVRVVLPSYIVREMRDDANTLSPLAGSSTGSVALVTLLVIRVGLETAIKHFVDVEDIGRQLAIEKSTVNPNHE